MGDNSLSTDDLLRILQGNDDDAEFSETESLDDDDFEVALPPEPIENQRPSRPPSNFNWTTERFIPDVARFEDFQSGVCPTGLTENSSQLDVFEFFIDLNIMQIIVNMTNSFQQFVVRNTPLKVYSRLQRWYDVTVAELYSFFALCMLMTRNRHLTIEEHWSTDPLLAAPIFGSVMSRNRFCMILGMLHFSRRDEEAGPLGKINIILTDARFKFKSVICPYRNLCIDESIMPFKGRLSIKQYAPQKRNRFGIKLFILCDVSTGIVVDFIVYCGASTEIVDPCNLGAGGAVVATLLRDFFGSNRHLYVDNWYTSPKLFQFLHEHNIYACGTVKKNRIGMPVMSQRLQQGEVIARYSPPLMAMKWKDKKDIYLLSSIHDTSMGPSMRENRATGLPVLKPNAIIEYSNNMGSVDTSDMLLSSLQCIRKSVKWYKKLFFHILDMHLLNSYLCYRKITNSPNLPFAQYQLCVIRQILEKYNSRNILPRQIRQQNTCNNPLRILPNNSAKHMPTRFEKYRRCKECSQNKRRKETRYACKICNVYLCVAPCFENYHK